MDNLSNKIIALLKSYCIPKSSHSWKDYEDAKYLIHNLDLDEYDYSTALYIVAVWVGV